RRPRGEHEDRDRRGRRSRQEKEDVLTRPMENALITLRRAEKDYESGAGTVRALREVNLEIKQGEFVAVVGTSGSGKSTLMNILGCLDRPTRGVYELAGFDVGARASDAR